MVIFKQQADKAKDNATTQMVLKERTQAERVHNESMSNHSPHTPVEVPYPNAKFGHLPETPVILQDEDDTIRTYPTANTWQQRKVRTITQDYLFHMMDIPGRTKPFSNQQAASCKYPLQFLCDFAALCLTTRLVIYLNTGTYSGTQSTGTHGASCLVQRFVGWPPQLKRLPSCPKI